MKKIFILFFVSAALSGASVGLSQTFTNGDWIYTLNSSNEATITGYVGSGGDVYIPAEVDGYTVKMVAGNLASMTSIFSIISSNLTNVTSVTIPDSVTSLSANAFTYCRGITNVNFGNGITYIAKNVFIGTLIKHLVLPPKLTYVDGPTFNPELETLAFPRSVSFIHTDAFMTVSGGKTRISFYDTDYLPATKSDVTAAISNTASLAVSQVQSQPNSYNLFNAEQYAANYNNGVVTGTALVTASPASYNLYTSNSIMDLAMGGLMIQKESTGATVVFQPQTTTDLTLPFTNNGTAITNTIPLPGNKGFLRIRAADSRDLNP